MISRSADGERRRVLLFSTSTTPTGWQIVELYRARFQIESCSATASSSAG